jgi:hypothetical protein
MDSMEAGATTMEAKFVFGGEGATIPGVNFPLSFALFKLWLRPAGQDFKG